MGHTILSHTERLNNVGTDKFTEDQICLERVVRHFYNYIKTMKNVKEQEKTTKIIISNKLPHIDTSFNHLNYVKDF